MLIVLRCGSPVGSAAEDNKTYWHARKMMRLALADMTNREIGARLGITEQWVSTLIQRRLREGWALTKTLGEFHQYHRK